MTDEQPAPELKAATRSFNAALRRYRAAQKRADERKVELDAAREIVMKAMAGAS